jgi:hypothetical protein
MRRFEDRFLEECDLLVPVGDDGRWRDLVGEIAAVRALVGDPIVE